MRYPEKKKSSIHSAAEDHHEERLKGLLKYSDLDGALVSIQKLDAIYREYRAVSDRVGTSLVRELVEKGEQRVKSMAASPRLRVEKRREKQELAKWFKVWLEVPDLFFDWLEMRQKSDEYQRLFMHPNGHSRHHSGK